jgi:tRNA(adenine34) deaminase
MAVALRAARAAGRRGEVPVGAVLVRARKALARGSNRTVGSRDPSGHAEIVVLRGAARRAGNHRLTGATLYVTLEPCPMCLGALIQARIRRVVYAAEDERAGGLWLLDLPAFRRRANHAFEIEGGVLREEAAGLLRDFFRRRRGRRKE